jgi:hypothetical protein
MMICESAIPVIERTVANANQSVFSEESAENRTEKQLSEAYGAKKYGSELR